jgi:hypothetical protein
VLVAVSTERQHEMLQPLGLLHIHSMVAKDLLMVVAYRQVAQSYLPHQTMPQYLVAVDVPLGPTSMSK